MEVGELEVLSRIPGSPSTGLCNFVLPGISDVQFCAWGTEHGSVAIASIQSTETGRGRPPAEPRSEGVYPLQSRLLLNFFDPDTSSGIDGRVMEDAITHLNYGGGQQVLLAVSTEQVVVICSLQALATRFYDQLVGSDVPDPRLRSSCLNPVAAGHAPHGKHIPLEVASPCSGSLPTAELRQCGRGTTPRTAKETLYRQLAAVRIHGAAVQGVSWTQQLDGLLVSQADGTLTMWQLNQTDHETQRAQHTQHDAPLADMPQLQSSGEEGWGTVQLVPAWQAQAAVPQDLLSAGASLTHPCASSAGALQERGANVWWPPAAGKLPSQEQDQQGTAHAAGTPAGSTGQQGGLPLARCERLRHPCCLTGLEWSPGVFHAQLPGPPFPSPSPSPDSMDLPPGAAPPDARAALMTVGSDGVVRIWVETVIVMEGPPDPDGSGVPAQQEQGGTTDSAAAIMSETGKPAPSSASAGRDVSALVERYLCMALVIEPPAVAPAMQSVPSVAFPAPPVTATWGRSPGCLLGRQHRHAAPPVLWLLSTAAQGGAGGSGGCELRLHAVRGLSPVVVSSYMGALGSGDGGGGGGGAARRPQALLWGSCTWGEGGAEAGSSTQHPPPGSGEVEVQQRSARQGVAGRCVQQGLTAWLLEERDFPVLHAVKCSTSGDAPAMLAVRCCVLETAEGGEGAGAGMHQRLAMVSSWHAEHAVHTQPIVSLCAHPGTPLLASLDSAGTVLTWRSTPSGQLRPAGPLPALPPAMPPPSSPIRCIAWVPNLNGETRPSPPGVGALLVAATASQLLFVEVAQGRRATTTAQQGQHEEAALSQTRLVGAYQLPGDMRAVQALHVLPAGSAGAAVTAAAGATYTTASLKSLPGAAPSLQPTAGSEGISRVWVAAICNEGTARLYCQEFAVQQQEGAIHVAPLSSTPPGSVGGGGQQLFRAVHAFASAVTASTPAGSVDPQEQSGSGSASTPGKVLMGLADGTAQLLRPAGPAGVAMLDAELALMGAPTALAASPDGTCIAAVTSGNQDALQIWRLTPQLPSRPPQHAANDAQQSRGVYVLEATLKLPDTPTDALWVPDLAAPTLAVVGCGGLGLRLYTKGNRGFVSGSSPWCCLAQLPTAALPLGVSKISLPGPGWGVPASLVGVSGRNELFNLNPAVQPSPTSQWRNSSIFNVAGWVLARAGPLPQYHPAVLAALAAAGKAGAVAAVAKALLAWLQALRRHVASQQRQLGGNDDTPSSLLTPLTARGNPQLQSGELGTGSDPAAVPSQAAAPEYQGVPVDEVVGDGQAVRTLMELLTIAVSAAAAPGSYVSPGANGASPLARSVVGEAQVRGLQVEAGTDQPQADKVAQPAAFAVESGQLDMSAFGLDGFGQPPPQPPQQPAASAVESGQLDMSAFGLDGFGQPQQQPQSQQPPPQPAAAAVESGQLDMSAFGLDGFGQPQQQPPPQPAASAVESGQLDMSAFGLDGFGQPQPPQPQQQPAASAVESGQLDMSASGLDGFGQPPPPRRSQAQQQPPIRAPLPAKFMRTPPSPPPQPLVSSERFYPVPAEVASQLAEELSSWQEDATLEGASTGLCPPSPAPSMQPASSLPQTDHQPRSSAATTVHGSAIRPIPGLSLDESAALLALLGALSPPADTPAPATSADPVDSAGASFLTAHGFALAGATSADSMRSQQAQQGAAGLGGLQSRRESGSSMAPRGASGASSAWLLSGASSASMTPGAGGSSASVLGRHVSVKNAAGVEYTLPPASSSASLLATAGKAQTPDDAPPLALDWGLLPGLDIAAVLWAVLSGTRQAVLSNALQQAQRAQQQAEASRAKQEAPEAAFLAVRPSDAARQMSWGMLRGMGAGFWVTDAVQAREVADKLAKAQYASSRNPDDCALLYCAMGKKSVLQGLYRTHQHRKLADFLARDFSQPSHRQAAIKNAFVLLGQHRHELGAAFFLLGGQPEDAVGVCAHEMHDVQLALLLCRVLWGPGSDPEAGVLERDVLPAVRLHLQGGSPGGATHGGGGQRAQHAPLSRPPSSSTTAGGLPGPVLGGVGVGAPGGEQSTGAGGTTRGAQSASSALALCKWLLGDVAGAVMALLGRPMDEAQGAGRQLRCMTVTEAVQLVPLLALVLPTGVKALAAQREVLMDLPGMLALRCSAAVDVLQTHAVHVLALESAMAACGASDAAEQGADPATGSVKFGLPVQPPTSTRLQGQLRELCALALLPSVVHAGSGQAHHGWRSLAQRQLDKLGQLGCKVDSEAVLSMLRAMLRQLAVPAAAPGAPLVRPLTGASGLGGGMLLTQRSTLSVQSTLSSCTGTTREGTTAPSGPKNREGEGPGPLLGEGYVLFRVDGDRSEILACCPVLAREAPAGRPLVVASRRHGLVEGEVLLLPPGEGAGGGDAAVASPQSRRAASEAGGGAGSTFMRLVSQVFDQSRWDGSDWVASMASEGELSPALSGALVEGAEGGPLEQREGRGPGVSFVTTTALCAHPTRPLFMSGCSSGRVHLWRFGGKRAILSFTPVPPADLGEARGSSLLSFSARLRGSPATSRLANWGKCSALQFSANGERFAAAGEGGVVSVWRLDSGAAAGSRPCDSDGAVCSDWWHQGLSRGAAAVEFVGGSSSVVALGGKCSAGEGGNISIWDTLAPPSSALVGRVGPHQGAVTSLCMLPAGWLLASGDDAGALCLSDLRMLGSGRAPKALWSVRAAHGAVSSIAWAAAPSGWGYGGCSRGGVVSASQDGAIRVWQMGTGRLVQALEPGLRGGGSGPALTGVTACPEGVAACTYDGVVKLYPFC